MIHDVKYANLRCVKSKIYNSGFLLGLLLHRLLIMTIDARWKCDVQSGLLLIELLDCPSLYLQGVKTVHDVAY